MNHQHCSCWKEHLRKMRKKAASRGQVRRLTGICIRCGKRPAKVGRAMCEPCLAENALAVSAHRQAESKRRAG